MFWANKGGTPGRLHSCDPFHGFPKAPHFWKTSKISKAPNIDPHNTSLVVHQPNKIKTHDGQTTRWHRMLHLDPGGEGVVYVKTSCGSGFKTLKTTRQKLPQPVVFMVDDSGYLWFWKRIASFSFHKSLFKKALLSHVLGQQRGYPRTASYVWPLPRFSQGPTFLENFQDFKGT